MGDATRTGQATVTTLIDIMAPEHNYMIPCATDYSVCFAHLL